MSLTVIIAVVLGLSALGYFYGRSTAFRAESGAASRWHSRPTYYGYYVALWCGLPALLIVVGWSLMETSVIRSLTMAHLDGQTLEQSQGRLDLIFNEIRNLATGAGNASSVDPDLLAAAAAYSRLHATSFVALGVVAAAVAIAGLALARRRLAPRLRARNVVERVIEVAMIACATIAILTTVGIVFSLVFEAGRFFATVSPVEFLFGLEWSPQIALRADQVGASGAFGAVPLFAGTLLISCIAMAVAMPIGLMSAIYTAEYADPRARAFIKPILEVLAGIPTVVYGFFAALTVAPFLRHDVGGLFGLNIASESALAAGVVMGIMLIPFVSSLSDDVITAVPQSMRDGSYGLGATQAETIRKVLIPAALPGIVGSFLLAVSRAIGETMIVVMAAGLSANLTANPFEAVTTVTVQIATLLVGDQEFDSPKTLAAFALGLVLFVVTLCLNIIALRVVRKYREQYE